LILLADFFFLYAADATHCFIGSKASVALVAHTVLLVGNIEANFFCTDKQGLVIFFKDENALEVILSD